MNTRINKILASSLMLALGPVVTNATPTFNPANGHYYEVVASSGITWVAADIAATSSTHLGISGHLATITSAAEDMFIDTQRKLVITNEAWVGGFQMAGCTPEPTCGWTWVNGEGTIPGTNPVSPPPYANWLPGEPNDLGTETFLGVGLGNSFGWNDEQALGNIGGYVVEYDTVPPVAVPDPINPANSGETIKIDVLLNDDDMGQEITAVVITTPSTLGGTATPVACTSLPLPPLPTSSAICVDYTSAAVFGGEDEFKYTMYSGDLASNEVLVKVQVDGSVSETPSGSDVPVFGGTENGVPALATGEMAENSGESSIECCTVQDSRVRQETKKGVTTLNYKWRPFDLGAAISSNPECADLSPHPNPGELIIARHFSVHTDPAIEDADLTIADHKFLACKVQTDVSWQGPVQVDVNTIDELGYSVDCKPIPTPNVDKQPLILGLTTFTPEYVFPKMRAVTVECDPRGVAKWSTWYFVPNAQHRTAKESSQTYTSRMSSVLKDMIEAMRVEGAVAEWLLNDVKSYVLDAEHLFKSPHATTGEAALSLVPLDMATVAVLGPDPAPPVYPGSGLFPNPKAELASHIMALRYAVCSEKALAPGDDLSNCRVAPTVDALLPPLP